MSERKNVYQEITDRIVEALESGVNPWIKPWSAGVGYHRNAISGRPYRGINVILLNLASMIKGYVDPRWTTFNAVKKNGGNVKKGERGVQIVFWKFIKKQAEPASEENGIDADDIETLDGEDREDRVFPLARYYTVFNVEQCEGLELSSLVEEQEFDADDVNPLAETVLRIANIRYGGSQAAYLASKDMIFMPMRGTFNTLNDFYVTAFHELSHWTGHESRLDRKLGRRFGEKARALEEMIVEIASAYIGVFTGVPFDGMQHPEYIGHWLEILKGDNKAVFTAASHAQKASDFILDEAGLAFDESEFDAAQNDN